MNEKSRNEVFRLHDLPPVSNFTDGKQYAILMETTMQMHPEVFYEVKDDEGNIRQIPYYYFNPEIPLVHEPRDKYCEEFDEVNLMNTHDEMEKAGTLQSSGVPDIVWNFKEFVLQAEKWKKLAGVEPVNKTLFELKRLVKDLVAYSNSISEEIAKLELRIGSYYEK
jgi:hypothetical protein